MYQFPECDSDEDEEFKQQDRELKVRNLLSRGPGSLAHRYAGCLRVCWLLQKELELPYVCQKPVLLIPRAQPTLLMWKRC